MSFGIMAVGNPGTGKSTILNTIAGEHLFRSGLAFGSGLTYQLDEKQNSRGRFIDTPGLADDKLRKAAGQAISAVLKRGGSYKILFFVKEAAGRVVRQDVATMRLVLDAAPEIRNNYGIVINQANSKIMEGVRNSTENAAAFMMGLFSGVEERRRCPNTSIIFLPQVAELEGAEDAYLRMEDLGEFGDFLNSAVPVINLTPQRADDIRTSQFDEMVQAIESLRQEHARNRAFYQADLARMRAHLQQVRQSVYGLGPRQYDRMPVHPWSGGNNRRATSSWSQQDLPLGSLVPILARRPGSILARILRW